MDFYSSIPPVEDFEALARAESYVPLPSDWWIVTSDIAHSTAAIEAGNYKAVNTVGVSVIAAITNAVGSLEVPYVFGGDGALLCVPGSFVTSVRYAMAATIAMSKQAFGLELRAAVVPVSSVREQGLDVQVARHRVSPHYVQCALWGGGSEFAERSLKSGDLPDSYLVASDPMAEADFGGLECRWSEVPSSREETVSVIVEATTEPDEAFDLYARVIDRIADIYGEADLCRPVTEAGLRVTLSAAMLGSESRLQTWKASRLERLAYAVRLRLAVIAGWFLLAFGLRLGDVDWGGYKRDLVANTDFRKFDGSLRLILSGDREHRRELEEYLNGLRRNGEVAFGIHVSQSALVTCLIEQRQSAHFHFVDGAGGGYAAAAKALKESLSETENPE